MTERPCAGNTSTRGCTPLRVPTQGVPGRIPKRGPGSCRFGPMNASCLSEGVNIVFGTCALGHAHYFDVEPLILYLVRWFYDTADDLDAERGNYLPS